MRTIKRLSFIFLLSLLSIDRGWSIDFKKNSTDTPFIFEFKNNYLQLNASDVPLSIIFNHFCKKTYVCPVIEGRLTENVSFLFNKVPIEQALKKLSNGKSFIIIYTSSSKDSIAEKRVIKEFRVFGEYFEAADYKKISLDERDKLKKIEEMSKLPDIDSIAELTKMLYSEKSTLIKINLIEGLSQRGGEHLVDTLASVLGDEASEVRGAVIHSLGNIRTTKSSLLLAQILYGDPNPELRKIVLEKLSTFSILPAKHFIQSAKKDKNASVQQEADYAVEAWKFSMQSSK